jgi:hypothetical protein
MNGQARRVGYRFQSGLSIAPIEDGGGSARGSTTAIAMDKERFEIYVRGDE